MNKLICEIKSALILNPAKRAAFREKHADDLHPDRRQRNLLYEALSTAAMHARTFLPFKGIHTGQNICLVASGPTAKDYQPLTDTIHIAVNASFRMQSIPFDYIFVHDIHNRPTILKEMAKYRPDKCKKFFGIAREHTFNTDSTCPESDSIAAQALRYRKGADSYELPLDISTYPLPSFGTVALPALQFALWTNPKRIYLVGCDCSSGYFDGSKDDGRLVANHNRIIRGYQALKRFAHKWYPDTEIVSINPVGLRDIFPEHPTV